VLTAGSPALARFCLTGGRTTGVKEHAVVAADSRNYGSGTKPKALNLAEMRIPIRLCAPLSAFERRHGAFRRRVARFNFSCAQIYDFLLGVFYESEQMFTPYR
jgi:hypothetical protein